MTADLLYPLLLLAVVVMVLEWLVAGWLARRHARRYRPEAAQEALERVEAARQEVVRADQQLAQARATGVVVDALLAARKPRELTTQRAA